MTDVKLKCPFCDKKIGKKIPEGLSIKNIVKTTLEIIKETYDQKRTKTK